MTLTSRASGIAEGRARRRGLSRTAVAILVFASSTVTVTLAVIQFMSLSALDAFALTTPLPPPVMEAPHAQAPSSAAPQREREAFADYKKWARLTKKPIKVPAWITGAACGFPNLPMIAAGRQSEHKDMYIHLYANAAALEEMTTRAITSSRRAFPAGSVIVKEKLAKSGDRSPAALGVMVKREDKEWDFFYREKDKTISGAATTHCKTCHQSLAGDRDWVFFPEPLPYPYGVR